MVTFTAFLWAGIRATNICDMFIHVHVFRSGEDDLHDKHTNFGLKLPIWGLFTLRQHSEYL